MRLFCCSLSDSSLSRFSVCRFSGWLGKAALLAPIAGVLMAGGNAQAVETIQLQYDGTDPSVPNQVTVTLPQILTFVQSGELPQQVREFFNINQEDPGPIRRVLTEEIQVPSNLRTDFTDTSLGRFVVSQLEDFVQGSNVAPNLQTALRQSIQDDRSISLLELIQNYPTESVTLNITGLVQVYDDVSAFVDRVVPALEVAREFLQDIVCDCPQTSAAAPKQGNLTAQQTCTTPFTAAPAAPAVQAAAPVQPAQMP